MYFTPKSKLNMPFLHLLYTKDMLVKYHSVPQKEGSPDTSGDLCLIYIIFSSIYLDRLYFTSIGTRQLELQTSRAELCIVRAWLVCKRPRLGSFTKRV